MSLLTTTTACSVHRIDIQQGNIVTKDMVDQVRIGMNKRQVQFVLGTPLVTNIFNPNRWDYVYNLREKGNQTEHNRLTLFFQEDELVKMEGDLINPPAFEE